jgi:hypothetical protein
MMHWIDFLKLVGTGFLGGVLGAALVWWIRRRFNAK